MRKTPSSVPLALVMVVLAVAVLPRDAAAQSGPASEIVRLVNELRATRGLPPYQVDSALTAAAQAHAEWNAANGIISHTGEGGTTPNDRALAAGYGGGASAWATENIAQGTLPYITPSWVVQMWQGDQVHLDAMISTRYEYVGVGYAEAGGSAFYVMMVGWVADEPPPPPAQPEEAEEAPSEAEAEAPPAEQALPPTPSFVRATPGPDGSIVHEVRAGESVWLIAANYDVDVADLLSLNGLPEGAFLQPGDRLLIRPASTPGEAPPETPPGVSAPSQPVEKTPRPLVTAAPPPRLTPFPSPTPTDVAPGAGPFRKVVVGAVVTFAVIGGVLVGIGLRKPG